MTEKEAIGYHLKAFYIDDEKLTYFSSLNGALKDARKITGRNILTGEKDNTNGFGHLGSWLGSLGYMILLENLGNCFKRKDGPVIEKNKSGIIKAFKNFSDLDDDSISVLYALRNSFAHNFSLHNPSHKSELRHHFRVINIEKGNLITFPRKKWDGKFESKEEENKTIINLQLLGDLSENVVVKVRNYYDKDNLEVALKGGYIELVVNYMYYTNEPRL